MAGVRIEVELEAARDLEKGDEGENERSYTRHGERDEERGSILYDVAM